MSIKPLLAIPLVLITIGISALKAEHSAKLHKAALAHTIEKPSQTTPSPAVASTPAPTPVPPTPAPPAAPVRSVQPVSAPRPVFYGPASCEAYRPIVASYGWNVRTAMAVMEAESGCQPSAANMEAHRAANGTVICYGSFGLFQISCHGGRIHDPAGNVRAAWAKYQARGWQPWGAYTDGSYREYLR